MSKVFIDEREVDDHRTQRVRWFLEDIALVQGSLHDLLQPFLNSRERYFMQYGPFFRQQKLLKWLGVVCGAAAEVEHDVEQHVPLRSE